MGNKYTAHLDPETESNYRMGKIEPGGYRFDVLAYPEPSQWGLDNGRISKLHIWNVQREPVVEYERGWPVDDNENPELPTPDQAQMIEAIKRDFPDEVTKAQMIPEKKSALSRIKARFSREKDVGRDDQGH